MNSMKGPYSTTSPCRLRNAKAGDKTMNVYNGDGETVCVVPRVTNNRFRSRKEAEAIAESIADLLNKRWKESQ